MNWGQVKVVGRGEQNSSSLDVVLHAVDFKLHAFTFQCLTDQNQ